ncbi:MAG: ATP-binding protein [Chlorobaculum sp.]|nr:ATP-binding protein [Chlorobaculum sp.]
MSSIITLTLPGEIMFARLASQTASSLADLVIGENREESAKRKFCHAFELAVSEAVTNSVTHAEEFDAPQMLTVTFEFEPRQLTVSVRDANPPFSIDKSAPDIESYPVHGFGLKIIREIMDQFTYRRDGDANIITMSKSL